MPNFKATLFTELKRVIATCAANKFKNEELTVKLQEDKMFKHYHGYDNIVGETDKFMKQIDEYSQLFEEHDAPEGRKYIVGSRFHREVGKMLVLGAELTLQRVEKTDQTKNSQLVSGRTARGYSKDALREGRKMLSLFEKAKRSKIIEQDGPDEFIYYSGNTEVDLLDFILRHMFNLSELFGASGEAVEKDDEAEGGGVGNERRNVNNVEAPSEGGTPSSSSTGADEAPSPNGSNVSEENEEEDLADASSASDSWKLLPKPPDGWIPKGWILFLRVAHCTS